MKNKLTSTIHVPVLILGGGISAISFAHFYNKNDYLIIEQSDRLGGLCKSFKVGESIFDYSGHFLHFKSQEMKDYVLSLVTKHATGEFKLYDRRAGIALTNSAGVIERIIDYPFQANIHQLEYIDFIYCLVELYKASKNASTESPDSATFDDLVRNTFGNGITDIFFKPYNEKLYKTPLTEMDANAMKRFIPKVTFDEVINNFTKQKQFGYNSTFIYSPTSGVEGVVNAFLKEKDLNFSCNETILKIDIAKKIVKTDKHTITYEALVNTLPLNTFTRLSGKQKLKLKSVDVHVYNITFDSKSSHGDNFCWLYFPGKVPFYRVGFYNYMSGKTDTSIYVEVSVKTGSKEKVPSMEEMIQTLMKSGVIFGGAPVKDSQKLVISPAYAILEKNTEEDVKKYKEELSTSNVHLSGRYGTWNYQSIEDNLIDAKTLAEEFNKKI